MEKPITLGVIGGSGLYAMDGLESVEEHKVETPFGKPSSRVITGELGGKRLAFLARHGPGHTLSPSEINYRANIYALKMFGVTQVISVSACGSLREDYSPGHIVVPNQLYDNTKGREQTFFDEGLVAHISVADPFCAGLSIRLTNAVAAVGSIVHQGGSFITIEGPRFSTRAESHTYRAWGMSIVGMTTAPEVFLAREAEMCYAVMAHVTDYDVWHVTEDPVTVEQVMKTIQGNTDSAKLALAELVQSLPTFRDCDCHNTLRYALTTTPDEIPKKSRKRLALFVDPYLD